MTYFLFGTLWSVLFWVVYITLGLFVTIRRRKPTTNKLYVIQEQSLF